MHVILLSLLTSPCLSYHRAPSLLQCHPCSSLHLHLWFQNACGFIPSPPLSSSPSVFPGRSSLSEVSQLLLLLCQNLFVVVFTIMKDLADPFSIINHKEETFKRVRLQNFYLQHIQFVKREIWKLCLSSKSCRCISSFFPLISHFHAFLLLAQSALYSVLKTCNLHKAPRASEQLL